MVCNRADCAAEPGERERLVRAASRGERAEGERIYTRTSKRWERLLVARWRVFVVGAALRRAALLAVHCAYRILISKTKSFGRSLSF